MDSSFLKSCFLSSPIKVTRHLHIAPFFFFILKPYINNLSVFIFILKTEMKIIHRSIHTRRLSTRSSSRSYSKKINSARTIHVVIRQSKQSKKTTTSSRNSSKSELVSHHCASTLRSSGWPDWTTFEKEHREHKTTKRKKRLAIFISSYTYVIHMK